jgi:hypothetical protein
MYSQKGRLGKSVVVCLPGHGGQFALTANDQAQLTGEATASEAAGELVRGWQRGRV